MPAPDFAVTAICRKQPTAADAGAGEWVCTLVWQGPDRRTLRDTYDLYVGTDGCFTATVSGESLGGPTLRAADGRDGREIFSTRSKGASTRHDRSRAVELRRRYIAHLQ